MDLRDFLKHFTTELHHDWARALGDLSDEQFHRQPSPDTNHIAFTAWHWLRTEDNVVQFVFQRQPTVWLANGLDERWKLPKNAQGTGMARDEAHAMRLPAARDVLDYAEKVWAATDHYLGSVTPEELGRIVRVMPFGEIPVAQAIGRPVIAHGNQHLGEIWLIREMYGLSGNGM